MDAQAGEEYPALPEDIIHAILEYLQHDKPTLATCSLTSRAWTSPCRRHLFRDIAVEISPYKHPGRIEAIVSLLRDSYDARAYLQTLTFKADIYNPFPANLDVVTFREILEAARSLRRFTLVDMFLTDEHSRRYTTAANTQPTISLPHLAISSNRNLTEGEYVTLLDVLLQTFAHLETLDLDVFMGASTHRDEMVSLRLLARYSDMAVFPTIDNLVFHPPSDLPLHPLYDMLRDSLVSSPSPSSVSFHGIRSDHEEVRARVSEFCDIVIDGAREVLHELEFHPGTAVFRRAVNASEVWNLPNLSRHHRLRTLTLPLECEEFPYSGEEVTWMLDSHAHILLRHPPSSLERLVLKVRIPYNRDTVPYLQGYVKYLAHAPYRPSWAALDVALSSLPSSPQVVIDFVGPWQGVASAGELERCMRELLPDTHKKGVLRVALEQPAPATSTHTRTFKRSPPESGDMLAALLVSLSVAAVLAYFAKSVLLRAPSTSSDSTAFGTSTGLSSEEQRKYQEQILRKRNTQQTSTEKEKKSETPSVMQPAQTDLAPPKEDPITVEQLKQYDGSDPSQPIYVAIKGTVFDVTRKADTYGKGKSYNLFAGKDASRALGMSSLKEEDAVSDYSTLSAADLKTLNDWFDFFSKRYNVVGKVVDLPPQGGASAL